MPQKDIRQHRRRGPITKQVYQVRLGDLQTYFHDQVFFLDGDDDDDDEAFATTYEAQALAFLRGMGAMLSVDAFLTISNDIVYARRLPPGLSSLQGQR